MPTVRRYTWNNQPARSIFRFLDLPREIRDTIYEFALVEPMTEHDHRCITKNPDGSKTKVWVKKIYRDRLTALCIEHECPVNLLKDPPLLPVSRQIREEGDEIYWSMNAFAVEIEVNQYDDEYRTRIDQRLVAPMQQFECWVDTVGMYRLKYLKDLKLQIDTVGGGYPPRDNFQFVVTLYEQKWLRLGLPNKYTCLPLRTTEMREHLRTIEMRMNKTRWQGQAIIEFFLRNKYFWSSWFFTYPEDEPWKPWEYLLEWPREATLEWFEDDDVEGGVAIEGCGGHGKGEGED